MVRPVEFEKNPQCEDSLNRPKRGFLNSERTVAWKEEDFAHTDISVSVNQKGQCQLS